MTLDNFGANDVAPGTLNAGKAINQTQLGTFVNNTNTVTVGNVTMPQRQALSKALRPKADKL